MLVNLALSPVFCFQCYTKQPSPTLLLERRSKSPAHVPELTCNSTAQWDTTPAFPELQSAFQAYGFPNQAMPAAYRALSFKQKITLPPWCKVTKSEHSESLWSLDYIPVCREIIWQNSSYLLSLKQQQQGFTAKKIEMLSRTWTLTAEISPAHLFYKKFLAHRYTSIQPLLVLLQHLLLLIYLPSQITIGLKVNREQSLWL